jgi:hypothetical protein
MLPTALTQYEYPRRRFVQFGLLISGFCVRQVSNYWFLFLNFSVLTRKKKSSRLMPIMTVTELHVSPAAIS